MTPSATSSSPAAGTAPRIGFAAQVDHTGVEVDAGPPSSSGLRAGTELFTAAERLGYDVGYVRTRHLQDALSSPLLFLAALGQSVQRMQLGTAVIPLRFENPGRLAEDLATADLLLGGRLRAGLGSGYSAHDAMYVEAYGQMRGERGEHVDRVLHELLALLDGQIVSTADAHVEGVEPGTPLRVQPQVPGLRSRLAYGAAGAERAAMAGSAGLGLQLATMVPDDGSGRSFESLQLDVVEAYREASRAAGYGEGHVMVSRQMIPVTGDAELERYVSLIPRERAAAPGVSGEHRSLEIGGHEAVYSQIVLDDPSVVAQALIADPVVQAADEIVLVLPFSADRTDQLRVLESFARDVVPHLLAAIVT